MIANEQIRESLRKSNDPNLVPLGNNLTDAEIDKLRKLFEETQVTQPLHYYGNKR